MSQLRKGVVQSHSTVDDATEVLVSQIPTDHPYVRHLSVPGEPGGFRTLPDPGGPLPAGTWRPSPALDPAFVDNPAHPAQVIHLHFGYEHLSPDEVTGWAAAVHRSGRGLVVTVHDLDNPHLLSQERHRAGVAAAVRAADRVVTLTPGAAREIETLWGITATVIPHPHVLPLDLVGTRAAARRFARPRVGVPFGVGRANIAWADALDLLAGQAQLDAVVRVGRAVIDEPVAGQGESARRSLRERLLMGAERGDWELDVVDPGLPERDVWRWLSALDALLLPYAWGTHSGWLEACADVGTSVIAPHVGYWHDQQPLISVPPLGRATAEDFDAAASRVADPADPVGGGLRPLSRATRLAQRRQVHDAHAAVYRAAQSLNGSSGG